MAGFRFYRPLALILLLATGAARSENPQDPPGLYDRPVLVIDPGFHTAEILSASADRDGRWAVTGSRDKTVRIWSLADGKLERTIRLPAGAGDVGKVYTVAMSPDGALIAAGGWTRATDKDRQEQIYLFDRATGTLVKRIEGLQCNVDELAFSRDGARLAGMCGGWLVVYARNRSWDEVARDEDYQGRSGGVEFASDGRVATTSSDRKLRLYAPDVAGSVHPVAKVELPDKPFRLAFSPPDGARLAVGYFETPRVDLFDGHSLATLAAPELTEVGDVHNLSAVAWSRDGATLVAGGNYFRPGGLVVAWSQGGAGPRLLLAETKDSVQDLVPLPDGDFLVADHVGLSRLGLESTRRWAQQGRIADFRGPDRLTVSADGARVGFGYEAFGGSPASHPQPHIARGAAPSPYHRLDQYNEEYAKNLRLKFADRDARDLASAIINTQDALYQVKPTVLLDKDANKKGILQALDDMRKAMASGGGSDLAVIHFSGHGALVDGKLYLLPYEVDSRSNAGIKSDGLSVEELRTEFAELGQHGRVLVLLDVCHSGATTSDGSPLSMDSTALRTALAAANVSVLTSSSGPEVSYETPELQHGAFTKALLDAFDDPAADVNGNGLITPTGLAAYVENRVPMLTGDKQHPGMEVRYDTTLFARSR